MKEHFVTYEQALALNDLGFKEPCIATIDQTEYFHIKGTKQFPRGAMMYYTIDLPLKSQVFEWFREKHNLRSNIMDFIDDVTGIEWDYEINFIGVDLDERGNYIPLVDYSIDDETRKFKTYEEAESACIDKLIEIVKNGR